MRVEALNSNRMIEFIAYCKAHKKEVDESFLYDEDLDSFVSDDENPTYIALDQDDKIIGAASIIIDEYYRRAKKGRFRIFHCLFEDKSCYEKLLERILSHTDGLEGIYWFVPTVNIILMTAMESIGFYIDRYSFFLLRDKVELPVLELSEGYEIKPFRAGFDESSYCEVRNAGFAKLKGSETPITPAMVTKLIEEPDYIDGGILMLYHKGKPVGIVRGAKDEHEGQPTINIGPLAIIPQYQGKGLGRAMLRSILHFAKDRGYDITTLCVNAENERAKALYIDEGFREVEAVACFLYDLKYSCNYY